MLKPTHAQFVFPQHSGGKYTQPVPGAQFVGTVYGTKEHAGLGKKKD